MFRKWLIAALIVVASPANAWRQGIPPPSGGMLLNLAQPSYFAGYSPFLNWWRAGSTMTLVSSINGTLVGQQIFDCPTKCSTPETYLDLNGELITPVPADVVSISRLFFTPVLFPQYQYEGTSFNNFAGQVWDIKWNGCASPTVTAIGGLGTGGTSSFGSNSGTVTLGSSGYSNVGLTFTMTAPCRANPPTNISVSQHQYASNVALGQVWNPDWVADVKFGILRLMDWMQTNNSGITDSSQLADLNSNGLTRPFFAAESGSPSGGGPAASISGSVLTVNAVIQPNFKVGDSLIGIGITPGTITIASLGTGTGGVGTYNLTCSGGCPTVTSQTIIGIPPVGSNYSYGPKGGVHPNVACSLGQATGAIIEYPIPIAATNQFVTDIATAFISCGVKVKYSYGNEDWNFSFLQASYVAAQSPISGINYAGYRAAQIFEIIYNIYGASNRSRWIGALGSQDADTSKTTAVIAGANSWVNGGATHTLAQLVDEVNTAPYFGDGYSGAVITNITAGATPTVSAASHGFVNGQVIKLFVSAGTMATVLNGNSVAAYATVSSATTNSFVINIDTTGLTYANPGSGSNYAMDATLFKMADQSAALNISTPATYPTKLSFFAQQFSKAILNGSASDASYGTLTVGTPNNLTNTANAIPSLLQQHALIANSNGLKLSEYEGGSSASLVGAPFSGPVPNQLLEYLSLYQFDTGVVGDSTNTISNLYATVFQALRNVNSAYSAQFNELQAQSQAGPWGALRFTPGDEVNPKWQALVTENMKGAYVDPTPPATGTCSYITDNFTNANSNTQTLSSIDLGSASADRLVLVGVSSQGGTISSVVIDGAVTLTQDVLNPTSGATAIYSGLVPSGSGAAHSIVVTYSGAAFMSRGVFVYKATGLISNIVGTTNTGAASGTTINETKGNCIIAQGNFTSGTPNYDLLSSVPSVGGTNTVASRGTSAYFVPTFTSAIFNVVVGNPIGGQQALATYR